MKDILTADNVNLELIRYIIELIIERTDFGDYADLKKKDVEDFVLRPFYFPEDELLIFNVVSAITLMPEAEGQVKMESMESEVAHLHKAGIVEDINWGRFLKMLKIAEKTNVSVFSVFYEWIQSSLYYRGIEYEDKTELLAKALSDILSQYSDNDEA